MQIISICEVASIKGNLYKGQRNEYKYINYTL